jgi:type I restriction enzyme, S subunit
LQSKQVTTFKETEIGKIPEDWELKELHEVADVIDPHPSHRAPKEESNGFPFAGIGDIAENGDIDLIKSRKIGEEFVLQQEKSYKIDEYTIGFGRVGTVGKIVKLRKQSFRYAVSPTLAVINPNENIDKIFLNYAIRVKSFFDQVNAKMTGTTRPALGIQELRRILILVPAKGEQKSIGKILNDLTNQIQNLQNQNRILGQIAQAIFKSWFVDFDGVTEFEDSELGKIPQGWKIVKLCEISKVIDSAHITPKYSSNGLSMVRVTNIQNGFLNLKGTLKVTRNVYEEFSKNYKPQKNDILMSRVGTYGIVCFVGTDEPFCLGQNTVVIHSILNYFIYHNLISKLTQNQIEAKIDGSTQKTITLKNIRNLLIVKPNEKDEEIIKKFNEKISTIFENIINNNYQIHVLTKTCDALLPKLMSGEIRV